MARTGAYAEAYDKVRNLAAKPSNNEMLDLYGYAKIADGEKFEDAKKPGMMDLPGKAKFNRWQKFHDENLSAADAQKKYVEAVDALVAKYGLKQ